MPITLKPFYMIRHGETEHNAARIMAGSTDSRLTENGKDQARAVQKILTHFKIEPSNLVHSNLSRARKTAEILNEVLGAPMQETPDLAEWHAGEWEGVSYDQCTPLLDDWVDPPGGETTQDFLARIKRGKNMAIENNPNPILIISHGGVFRAFGKLYGINIIGVPNCTLYEFTPNPAQSVFPWDVWEYSNNDEPTRKPSMVYSDPLPPSSKIA